MKKLNNQYFKPTWVLPIHPMEKETFKCTVDGVDFELTKTTPPWTSSFGSLYIKVELLSKSLDIYLRDIHLDLPINRSVHINKDYDAHITLSPRLKVVINDRYTPIHLTREETKEFQKWVKICMAKTEDRRDSFIEDLLDD